MSVINPALLRLATDYLIALAFDRSRPLVPLTDPDWLAAFREASGIHGLGPFLGLRIEHGELDVPESLAGWLVGQADRNRARLHRMCDELIRTCESLVAAGVVPIPLKGAAMLLQSPDAMAWRSMGDIDLLVDYDSDRSLDLALARAGHCLHSASWKHRRYTTCAPGPPLVLNDGEHPDNPRDLEIHAAVAEMFRGFRWDITPILLRHRRPTTIPSVAVPNDDAMSVHLTVHASIGLLEGTSRAIHLIDLARALDRSGIDPLMHALRDAGIESHARFLYPSLAFTARETGSCVAQEGAGLLAPFVTAAMRDWAASASLYQVSWAGRHDRAPLDRGALWARSRVDRARMLSHTILPSPIMLADFDDELDGLAMVPRRYFRHYRQLIRRVI